MDKEIEFKFSSPADSPGYLLWQLTMLWQRQMNRVLKEAGVTHTQFVILTALGWLSKTSNEVTQVDIATLSNTDRMMVSKILRKLQEEGIIKRRESETDTRAKYVFLTERGAEILQDALSKVETTDLAFFGKLGTNLPDFNRKLNFLLNANKDH